MPSPFPGMNPYLEQADVWHDFHESFMPAAREALAPQLDPNYIAKIDEHIYIHDIESGGREFLGRADVGVVPVRGEGDEAIAAVLDSPARVRLPDVDREGVAFLEIRDRRNRALVTVVELLSPANKRPGEDRRQYLTKRNQLIANGVNLVEIDLLRGGPRMPMHDLPPCDYCAVVARPEEWPDAAVWPIALRDPLPPLPVPLRSGEPHATLDLRALLDRLYDAANYRAFIYDGTPEPPLSPDDAAWAAKFVPRRP